MCEHHHHSKNDLNRATESTKRHGHRLEDGAKAHAEDHAKWNRRDFLIRSGLAAAGTSFMLGKTPLTAFGGTKTLQDLAGLNTDRVLVLIQLGGGNDGLNTLVPYSNSIYYSNRPTIAVSPGSVFTLDNDFGLHPSMSNGLGSLWNNNSMAVMHNVGYQNQNRSHFRSTDIWASATNEDDYSGTGWAGRFLNNSFGDENLTYPVAMRVGGGAPLLFQSEVGNLGITFADANQFDQFVERGGFYDENDVPSTFHGDQLSFVRSRINASYKFLESIRGASNSGSNAVAYPQGLGQNLARVARLIRGGLKTRIFVVSIGGFDTHSNQVDRHPALIQEIADSVKAFYDDLGDDGIDKRVLTATFSEFGRTLNENTGRGTDHGSSAPLFLFGTGLNGGLYGEPNTLTAGELDSGGDPQAKMDFRNVYHTILEDWFGLNTAEVNDVIGSGFSNLGFVNSPVAIERPQLPAGFGLSENYPNPFRGQTTISMTLPEPAQVSLSIYDTAGRQVAVLADGMMSAGTHRLLYTAPPALPSGTYFYRLQTNAGYQVRKMILIK